MKLGGWLSCVGLGLVGVGCWRDTDRTEILPPPPRHATPSVPQQYTPPPDSGAPDGGEVDAGDAAPQGPRCEANTCNGHGQCDDSASPLVCTCDAGYQGDRCELDIDECAAAPCQNGGSCSDAVASYTCTCVAGFGGTNCQTNLDDCAPNPCQNGGTCSDGVASYSCTCAPGSEGDDCETSCNATGVSCLGTPTSTPCCGGTSCASFSNTCHDCDAPLDLANDGCGGTTFAGACCNGNPDCFVGRKVDNTAACFINGVCTATACTADSDCPSGQVCSVAPGTLCGCVASGTYCGTPCPDPS